MTTAAEDGIDKKIGTQADTRAQLAAELPSLDAAAQQCLGAALRGHYRRALTEPVPERLLTLLDQLAKQPLGKGTRS